MAKFAEINSENLVTRVVMADDNDIANNGGSGSQQAADYFTSYAPLSINGVRWIETFSDGTRGQEAGIGNFWNEEHQIFCEPQLYASWNLNTNTGAYEPPITRPANEDGFKIEWDEDNLQWKRIKVIADDGSIIDPPEKSIWNPSTSAWE